MTKLKIFAVGKILPVENNHSTILKHFEQDDYVTLLRFPIKHHFYFC